MLHPVRPRLVKHPRWGVVDAVAWPRQIGLIADWGWGMADDSSGLSEWADVLMSALGGGVIALLVWVGLSEPCPVGTSSLTVDCVRAFGSEWSLGQVALFVPLLAAAVGVAIHLARE
jgi:hypothetical protein